MLRIVSRVLYIYILSIMRQMAEYCHTIESFCIVRARPRESSVYLPLRYLSYGGEKIDNYLCVGDIWSKNKVFLYLNFDCKLWSHTHPRRRRLLCSALENLFSRFLSVTEWSDKRLTFQSAVDGQLWRALSTLRMRSNAAKLHSYGSQYVITAH